ncbi:MAG: hypothetical protein ABIH99_03080 [Candidatus Micrarchaeota archaeon]
MSASDASVEELVGRFRQIMGPVADTLAKEAARELDIENTRGKYIITSEAERKKLVLRLKEKFGKIIGIELADSVIADKSKKAKP